MSKITKECSRGHIFEPDYPESDDCPFCAQLENSGYRSKKTVPIYPDEMRTTGPSGQPSSVPRPNAQTAPLSRSKTVSVLTDLEEPVAGWLVAISGPLRGQDFKIPMGRSSFGRSTECRIIIEGDPTISSQQGYINYSRNRRFTLSPGEGSSLVYLDGTEVLAPVEIKAYSILEMGNTKLSFIPFCGDQFDWGEASQ